MANQEPKSKDNNQSEANNYAKYTGLIFQMMAIIGIMAYAGYRIDNSAGHHTKWVTAVLSLLGVFISLILVIRATKS